MSFSKHFKEGFEWRGVTLDDAKVEQLRKDMIAADIDLFGYILAEVKQKFPDMDILSRERIALAVFEKKADSFYTLVQNRLDERIKAERMASAKPQTGQK